MAAGLPDMVAGPTGVLAKRRHTHVAATWRSLASVDAPPPPRRPSPSAWPGMATLRLYPEPGQPLGQFWVDKFEAEAAKHWEQFYRQKGANFFKDRRVVVRE